jgi:hypothetical protein
MVNTMMWEKRVMVGGVRRRKTIGAMVVAFVVLAVTAAVVLRREGPTVTEMGMNRSGGSSVSPEGGGWAGARGRHLFGRRAHIAGSRERRELLEPRVV